MPADVSGAVLAEFSSVGDVEVSVIHGDPSPSNIRIGPDGRVGLLDWDESRVDVVWHDLSNLGIQVLGNQNHARATRMSDEWETANAWVAEAAYARRRFAALSAAQSTNGR
jgi:aminoglycoside phosphotransferase (APT) family kinase protein